MNGDGRRLKRRAKMNGFIKGERGVTQAVTLISRKTSGGREFCKVRTADGWVVLVKACHFIAA